MLVAVFGRQGMGGRVLYGYREVARVGTWKYQPDDKGAGTVDVELFDIHPAYAHKSDVALELTTKTGGVLRWPEAELLSDTCLVVPGPPQA
jgi:hypothetical protein